MEKKIEDYLHLYLGCECLVTIYDKERVVDFVGINESYYFLVCEGDKAATEWFKEKYPVKPILRPLSDMTEGERKELWDIVFQKRFISEFKGNTVFINKDNNGIPRWVLSSGVERLGIQFDGRIWADSDLHVWDHNQHEITRWLLNKGFDLFSLIESGLAIDKTTLNYHGAKHNEGRH